jgi:hypothetical protein
MNKQRLFQIIQEVRQKHNRPELNESVLLEHIPLDDEEGGMAMGELKTSAEAANEIAGMLQTNTQLEAWVQSKITKAKDYLVSVRDYLKSNPDAKE